MNRFLNKITTGDANALIPQLRNDSIHCCISDIPYGIGLDEWDVLHANANSALLGQSPAQLGQSGFKRRGKPIRGWSEADRSIPKEYQEWCGRWASALYPIMKDGASVFIFGARRTLHRAIVALEDCGFLLKDIIAWEKKNAHHRAQRISVVLSRRGLHAEAERWSGWRLGNLAPIWESIAWLFKPYPHTITDTVLENEVGALNISAVKAAERHPSNLIHYWFEEGEGRWHEAQKPLSALKFLINLSTREHHVDLDPFIDSGSTAVAAKSLRRQFIGFEIKDEYARIAKNRLASIDGSPVHCTESTPQQSSMFDKA